MCAQPVHLIQPDISGHQPVLPATGKAALDGIGVAGDVIPGDLAPVITLDRPKEIRYMRWGLVPSYVADLAQSPPLYNARAETLMQRRSFSHLLTINRCLILNRGFYEEQKLGNERVTWRVNPVEEAFFYKAGLWTTWRSGATGEMIESFTMITCHSQDTDFRRIHHRMPVILNKAERRLWMNPKATQQQLLELLIPCRESMYSIREYSRGPLEDPKGNSVSSKAQSPSTTLFD